MFQPGTYTEDQPGPVTVFGDSLALSCADLLRGSGVAVRAAVGATWEFAARFSREVDWSPVRVLVVALGSNPSGCSWEEERGYIASALPPLPLVLVTVTDWTDNRARAWTDALNAHYRTRADVTVEWAAATRTTPGLLHPDGVHLTEQGRVSWAHAATRAALTLDAKKRPAPGEEGGPSGVALEGDR